LHHISLLKVCSTIKKPPQESKQKSQRQAIDKRIILEADHWKDLEGNACQPWKTIFLRHSNRYGPKNDEMQQHFYSVPLLVLHTTSHLHDVPTLNAIILPTFILAVLMGRQLVNLRNPYKTMNSSYLVHWNHKTHMGRTMTNKAKLTLKISSPTSS
jgi:hypothetical protein